MEVGLSLGSNMGDRLERLSAARSRISSLGNTRVITSSPVYETEPAGVAKEHLDRNICLSRCRGNCGHSGHIHLDTD